MSGPGAAGPWSSGGRCKVEKAEENAAFEPGKSYATALAVFDKAANNDQQTTPVMRLKLPEQRPGCRRIPWFSRGLRAGPGPARGTAAPAILRLDTRACALILLWWNAPMHCAARAWALPSTW